MSLESRNTSLDKYFRNEQVGDSREQLIVLGWIFSITFVLGISIPANYLSIGIFALIAALPALIFGWRRPEFIILTFVFLSSDFVLPDQYVDLRVAGGGLDLRDLFLISCIGVGLLKQLFQQKITIPFFPVGGLLLVFLVMVIISLINALVFENVSFNWAFSDFRILLYYTLFFSVAWSITKKEQISNLLLGLFAIANLTVIVMIIQQLIGIDSLLLPGMASWQISLQSGSTVRILPPLIYLIVVLMVITFAYIFLQEDKKWKGIALAQFGFLFIGLLLTFTRSAWISGSAALLIILAYFAYYNKRRAALASAVLLPVVISLAFVFATVPPSFFEKIPLGGEIIARGLSIFTVNETSNSDSLEWRWFENGEAVRSISERPIFGVGLGNQYREITIAQGEAAGFRTSDDNTRLTRYVHNSLLSMAVKMGVPTLVLFLSTYTIFIYEIWLLQKKLTDETLLKSIILGVIAISIPSIFWSLFFSLFTELNHILTIAIFMGIAAVIARISQEKEQQQIA